jgi:hypothetical protein
MFHFSKLPCLGWRSADFLQVFLPKMFAGPVQTCILVKVLRFLWANPFHKSVKCVDRHFSSLKQNDLLKTIIFV